MKSKELENICGTCGVGFSNNSDCVCDHEVTNSVAYLEENENEDDDDGYF